MRPIHRWLPMIALAAIALATLRPTGAQVASNPYCLLCGSRGFADAILNTMLFAPLGAALAFRRLTAVRAILFSLAVSVTLELLQFSLAGRDSTLGDVLFNTGGAAIGWLVVAQRESWIDLEPKYATSLAAGALIAAFALLASGAVLIQPGLPTNAYYGQWTPEFENMQHYGGRVSDARIGDIRIPSTLIGRSAEVRTRVLRGVPLQVTAISGPQPDGLAPIFNLYDDEQREVILLGVDRTDLVFRYRPRAVRLRLDWPQVRLRRALAGIQPGDTLRLSVQRVRAGFCIAVNGRRSCPSGFAAADLWTLLLAVEPRSAAVAVALDFVVLALLFVPAGFWLLRPAMVIPGVVVSALGLVVVSRVGGLVPPAAAHFVAAAVGLAAGYQWRAHVQARRSIATSSATQRSMRT